MLLDEQIWVYKAELIFRKKFGILAICINYLLKMVKSEKSESFLLTMIIFDQTKFSFREKKMKIFVELSFIFTNVTILKDQIVR